MTLSAPPVRFPDQVRADLNAREAGLADATELMMRKHVRPCIAVTAERVSNAPLRRRPLARALGRTEAPPVLDAAESKFGGSTYCESADDWSEHDFLGQIDLATATAVLPPGETRLEGLLRLDLRTNPRAAGAPIRVKWLEKDCLPELTEVVPRPVGAWEARLRFRLEWTLPEGQELARLWPGTDRAWYEYDRFYPDGYNTDWDEGYHRMFGHKSSGLDEHYGFSPPEGRPRRL